MGLDLAPHFPLFTTLAQQASDALGFDLLEIISNDEAKLNTTAFTQPALLWASVACYRAFREHGGPAPTQLCGHSLGEFSALVAAGVLEFTDAVRLVHQRGLRMQEQVPPQEALMAAIIGLDDEQVMQLCQSVCQALGDEHAITPANFNAKGQVVVAGKAYALDSLITEGKHAGAKRILPLTMSVPSHCGLMQKARDALADYAHTITFHDAHTPVVQNINATEVCDAVTIKNNLLDQLTHPVLWRQSMETLSQATVFVESGPGSVLQGLAKRSGVSASMHGLGSLAHFNQASLAMGLTSLT